MLAPSLFVEGVSHGSRSRYVQSAGRPRRVTDRARQSGLVGRSKIGNGQDRAGTRPGGAGGLP